MEIQEVLALSLFPLKIVRNKQWVWIRRGFKEKIWRFPMLNLKVTDNLLYNRYLIISNRWVIKTKYGW